MASTGGGAARSSKKKNPDIADQEEISATDLVGTVGTIDSVERKIDLLVATISALTNSVNTRTRLVVCLVKTPTRLQHNRPLFVSTKDPNAEKCA